MWPHAGVLFICYINLHHINYAAAAGEGKPKSAAVLQGRYLYVGGGYLGRKWRNLYILYLIYCDLFEKDIINIDKIFRQLYNKNISEETLLCKFT